MIKRIFCVWYRHYKVYTKNFFTNALPPFLEPMVFLLGIGFGLGRYLPQEFGAEFIQFLASGLLVTSAMFTSAYECTYGSYTRLEFDKIYDGMLSAPISVRDIVLGEVLWAGSKGLFFSLAALVIMSILNIFTFQTSILAPIAGFLTGLMFSTLSLSITSVVKSFNNFNFYFSGFISPMFFFSGVVFPLDRLPTFFQIFAEFLPLTHCARLARFLAGIMPINYLFFWDIFYIFAFIAVFLYIALIRFKKILID